MGSKQTSKKKPRDLVLGIVITVIGVIVLLLLVAACDHLI